MSNAEKAWEKARAKGGSAEAGSAFPSVLAGTCEKIVRTVALREELSFLPPSWLFNARLFAVRYLYIGRE